MLKFTGFSAQFPDFLFSLQFIGKTELSEEIKEKYKLIITRPLTHLFHDLTETVEGISPDIETRMQSCVSSMYSDMRFSAGPPLKTYMYLRFREPGRDTDIPGLYFDMGYDYYTYGIRIYKQTGTGIIKIRAHLLREQKRYAQALREVKRAGFSVVGESYKKNHYPEISEPNLNDLLNKRYFIICRKEPISDRVFCGSLAAELISGFLELKDTYRLICGHTGDQPDGGQLDG